MLGVLAGLRFHVWNLAVLEAEGALRGSEKWEVGRACWERGW
jgi:hypothetical protein